MNHKNLGFLLDQLSADDAAALSRLMVKNSERFERFFPMTLAQNLTEEASKAFILLKNVEFDYQSEFTFAIREQETKSVIGLVILKNIDRDLWQGELAYCIDSEYEGRGWTSQAIKQTVNFAFTKVGLKTLQIIVHHTNKASIGVAMNCGFSYVKILKEAHTPPNENALDMMLFELYANR
ncbi:N-acetyltransferase [Euzebyella marina]|uniref:N-acetyltransferase n=1 Tax=Euzebyella marina TaxID=1761453 RepID=A0A3G2L1P6_9FLAO|nr:GNAT family N-acetyltransferase [Euzebyella marina]AYN66187.1 N-acetyltransferase [Euzebyella marina]